jgi:asparagine synthase (glutamine-hydrolysing)
MCGIAGQYCFKNGNPDRKLLATMSERLIHRGPDGKGEYINEVIGMIHRRLAIIDLSADGIQPMTNEDKSLWLVFNGEIYNYIELREDLTKKGHIFKSQSDTEVILHAYEEWGSDCLNRFNGMWAFALWDEKKQELFCARDRFGIKPFYYTVINGSFIFASEIKALLAYPDVGNKPNDNMVYTYLAWGVQDHCDQTMFEGIFQILPGNAMIVNKKGIKSFRYWDIQINPTVDDSCKFISLLRDLLANAVRLHLRSDVVVGTCLSGGIDSSTIVALIKKEESHLKQKTFSVTFKDKQFDESKYIHKITSATGIESSFTEPSADKLWDDIDRLIYIQDEPFGSLSIYAQYCVMRLASKQVKVILDGQGADELFAGYIGYQSSYIRGLITSFKWGTAICEITGTMLHHHDFVANAIRQLIIRKKRRVLLKHKPEPINRYQGSLDQVLYRELTSTNLPALLHYEDRNSMAFSVEARVPYLDINLVNYIAVLPLNEKIRNGITKISLREATKYIIPESIRNRQDKMGFVTPEEQWMKHELKSQILNILVSKSFNSRSYWDAKAVTNNYLEFIRGKSAYSFDIWRIICTELWLRKFIDQ